MVTIPAQGRRVLTVATFGLATVAFLLSGCATTPVTNNYNSSRVNISEPHLDQSVTRGVGETLLRQAILFNGTALRIEQEFRESELGSSWTIKPGYYEKVGEDSRYEYFRPEKSAEGGEFIETGMADHISAVRLEKGKKGVCIIGVGKACANNLPYTVVQRPRVGENSFQQTLIYNGRVGNRLRIGYRETSGNLARPAFNNEIEYDLSTSNVISYRQARIEVLEATNEFIRYKVKSNFNQANSDN